MSIELTVPSRIETGLSDRESRRRLGQSLRVASYQFTSFVEGDALYRLRSALKTRTTERVAMPLWPAMRHPSEFSTLGIEGGLNLTCDLLSRWINRHGVLRASCRNSSIYMGGVRANKNRSPASWTT